MIWTSWSSSSSSATATPQFAFLDAGMLIDRELELVEPDVQWIDPLLNACAHPAGKDDPTAFTTRSQLNDLLRAAPHGRYMPGQRESRSPAYQFWMHLNPQTDPPVSIAGTVSLRVGDNEDLRMYLGHVGYNVLPAARGHHYAERSVRLLLLLARRHGLEELWITCNPENIASRRTCERLGAQLIDVVPIPADHVLYLRGDRQKCRYHLPL